MGGLLKQRKEDDKDYFTNILGFGLHYFCDPVTEQMQVLLNLIYRPDAQTMSNHVHSIFGYHGIRHYSCHVKKSFIYNVTKAAKWMNDIA